MAVITCSRVHSLPRRGGLCCFGSFLALMGDRLGGSGMASEHMFCESIFPFEYWFLVGIACYGVWICFCGWKREKRLSDCRLYLFHILVRVRRRRCALENPVEIVEDICKMRKIYQINHVNLRTEEILVF